MTGVWKFLTDFGDTAVTVPLAVLMAGCLAAARQYRLATGWSLAILGCAAAIGGLKLAFAACGAPLVGPSLTSPSGHAAMSLAVYGGFATVLGACSRRAARGVLAASGLLLAIGIGVSRIVLHHHSPLEVAFGQAVGGGALTFIFAIARRHPPLHLPLRSLALTGAVIALLCHGEHWPAERAIHHVAHWFDFWRLWCR